MSADFIPGLQLAGEFYRETVRPLLDKEFPGLPYAAALLGPGSEVLGFDTPRSVDHDWGPRLQVFLADGTEQAQPITDMLTMRLPATFRGYPVAFARTGDPAIVHRVLVSELGAWLTGHLGFDARHGVTWQDWLATPAQRLAEGTAGAVFHDGPGELTQVRARLEWYPPDVWRYALAAEAHNRLRLTAPLDTATRGFYDRPFQVIGADRFAAALTGTITDPAIRNLPPTGTVDQFIDSTDALGDLRRLRRHAASLLLRQ